MMLDALIPLISQIENPEIDLGLVKGTITLAVDDIPRLSTLDSENLIEIISQNGDLIEAVNLKNHIGESITLEIRTGNINNYFQTLQDFIDGNKFKSEFSDFYIAEIDYRENTSQNDIIDYYKQNLRLISLLHGLADSEKEKGRGLNLLFYKSGKGADLLIDYTIQDLKPLNIAEIDLLEAQIQEAGSGGDKKHIFVNELVNFIESTGNSYSALLNGWSTLLNNYNKSVLLFIAGFSFEKVKTSSNEHFQKLVDKISELIGKASAYIFGVPVGYILLLNGFDYSGLSVGKNLILLILGTIFFVLIWCVLFRNIAESIENIEIEIDDFIAKIDSVVALDEIKERLKGLKEIDLRKQKRKLVIVEFLTIVIYLLLVLVYTYSFIDTSVYYL